MVTCSSTEAWNLCFWIHDIFTVPSTIVYKILYWLWHVLLGGFFLLWCCDPTWVMASSFLMFLDHTRRCTTVGRTPLDEWSARRRDLYLTTHNNHNRQTSMPPVGFEPSISEQPQSYALDHVATGTGKLFILTIGDRPPKRCSCSSVLQPSPPPFHYYRHL